jgi:hypothetical protein
MARKRQTRYRNSDTGRFVSASTWKRSKAQGGTRYKRTTIKVKTRKKKKPPKIIGGEPRVKPIRTLDELEDYIDESDEELEEIEFEGAFDS